MARSRNELTGRDPPTRHCGSAGKAGREKGGGRDRDLGLRPAREAAAGVERRGRGGVVVAEPAEGAGPMPLGNLRLLLLPRRPREVGKRSEKFGNLRHRRRIVREELRR